MSAPTDLEMLRGIALGHSLLGSGLEAVGRALTVLVEADALDPPLALRRAALLHLAGSPRDRQALAQALELARSRQDLRSAAQALLWQLRWGLESGGPIPPEPPRLPASLADDAELVADLALVEALSDPPQARACQERALRVLPSPARDHDRLDVMVQLACTERDGGDLSRARQWLHDALTLAHHHAAARASVPVSLTLGLLELEAGDRDAAAAALKPAIALGSPEQLEVLAASSALLALHLDAGRFDEGLAVADVLDLCARARDHALARADAAIGRSTCLLRLGRRDPAVAELLRAVLEASRSGVDAAVNLLRARLAELRVELGAESFATALAAASGDQPRG